MLTTRWQIGVMLALLAVSPASGQRRADLETERFDKLGTRPPPLPPGEGGNLIVTAPASLCTDATRELRIHYYRLDDTGAPASAGSLIRLLAGPSTCQWEFDGMPPGDYDAVIEGRGDGRIVAIATREHVWPGLPTVLTLELAQVEVEGVVTAEGRSWDQIPLASDLRLVFKQGLEEWRAPLDENGRYGVILGGAERTCMTLEHTPALGVLHLGCHTFYPTLQRFDLDHVKIPGGVIRLEVPPVGSAGFGDFVRVRIYTDTDRSGLMSGFKLLHGLRGEFFAELNREYRITVTPCSRTCAAESPVLASATVMLSSEDPIRDVTLPVASIR